MEIYTVRIDIDERGCRHPPGSLCGGLAFFLFGMHVMSQSLEKITGGKLESTLKKMTSNPLKSLPFGIEFIF